VASLRGRARVRAYLAWHRWAESKRWQGRVLTALRYQPYWGWTAETVGEWQGDDPRTERGPERGEWPAPKRGEE
jgi:hypothetical protein